VLQSKEKGGEKMKKVKMLIPALLMLTFSALAMPVMAFGPQQAAEVKNNPNLTIGSSGEPVLDTPSGIHNLWVESEGYFGHYINASSAKGKMNNAVTVGPLGDVTLSYLLAHLSEFENRWLYLNQQVFYYLLVASGVSNPSEVASRYPDGIYWHIVFVG
jgi:hypothetical protein